MADSKTPESRRVFIKRLGAVAGAGLAAAPACTKKESTGGSAARVSGKVIHWKMVTTWPKNFPALGTGANYLAETLKELTDGQLQVQVYAAGELVPALGVFDAVSRGTAEMGHGAAYYWKGKHEAAQFFAAVPFGLNAQESNGWLYHGGGLELWNELYSGFGMRVFPSGNTGVQMGGWFNKSIDSVEQFKGLKMRMPGLGGEVLRRLGATVVTLPGGEIFQSLKSGAIDATEWVGPYNDLAFGLYNAAKYYYWPGWHEPGSILECMVNEKAYAALPKSLQSAVRVACEAANANMLAEFTARNSVALDTLVTQHKVQLKKFPDAVLKTIGTTSKDVVSEIAKKDPFSKKVFASFDAFRKKSISWGTVSEQGYSLAREGVF